MKYRIFLFIFLSINSIALFGQKAKWNWAAQIVGSNWSVGYDVATDANNNVYSCGFFIDSARFGENQLYSPNQVAYIVKYNADGEVKWVNTFTSDHSSFAEKVSVDSKSNIFVTGYFSGKLIAGNYILNTDSYIENFFLVKIDSSGTVLWARQSNSSSNNHANAMSIDASDHIYLAGDNNAYTNFGNLIADKIGMFIVKYDTNGTPIQLINESGCNTASVNAGFDNRIYFSGSLIDTTVIKGDTLYPTGYYQYINNGWTIDTVFIYDRDHLFICYNNQGNVEWYRQAKSKEYDERTYTVIDNQSNLYVAGNIVDTTDFWGTTVVPEGYSKPFLMKMNSSGNISWVETGSPVSEYGGLYLKNVTTQNNIVYVTGAPYETSSFAGMTIYNTGSSESTVILKIDSAGNGLWPIYDTTNLERNSALAVTPDRNDNIIICGYFEDSVHYGNHYLNSLGNGSPIMFVAKMSSKPDDLHISEHEAGNGSLTIFPNPTHGEAILHSAEALSCITILNSTGQVICKINSINQTDYKLQRPDLPGIYFIRAVTGKQTITKKLIVIN